MKFSLETVKEKEKPSGNEAQEKEKDVDKTLEDRMDN
jgi:hypothetical protein